MMTRENVLEVQADMLSDLTPEQRERYDAVRRQAYVITDDPHGLIYCETCGYMHDPQTHATHRCNGRNS